MIFLTMRAGNVRWLEQHRRKRASGTPGGTGPSIAESRQSDES